MALNRVHALYGPRWQAALARTAEAAFAASVALYEVEGRVYDPVTDAWNETTTSWYVGPARVQPVRTARMVDADGNATTVQGVRVSIPIDQNTLDFRPGLRLVVTEAVLNPSLTELEFILRDVVDSSNPFERTLEFLVDQEDEADYVG